MTGYQVVFDSEAAVRRFVDDVAWSLWESLRDRPQFRTLTSQTFLLLRHAIDRVLVERAAGGCLTVSTEALARMVDDLVDQVSLLLEEITGGTMSRGPLNILVETSLQQSLDRMLERAVVPLRRSA